MEYLPSTQTTINLVISVGAAFIIGKQLSKMYATTTYATMLVQIGLVVPLYYMFSYVLGGVYRFVTGSSPKQTPPQTSVTPNIKMFPSDPLTIPTNVGTSSRPIVPSQGGTTATSSFGTSFLMSINTTVANPSIGPGQLDYAPLVDFMATTSGKPVLTIGYMPQGNLLQAIFYEGGAGDSLDIPTDDAYDTRLTIGTPPIKKRFSVFLRTRPSSPNHVTVEVYINGVLGKTLTVRSLFFGGSPGGILPSIGYASGPNTYPAVDAEIQSLMVWGNASALTLRDIQQLSTQQMNTEHASRHMDTTRCNRSQG